MRQDYLNSNVTFGSIFSVFFFKNPTWICSHFELKKVNVLTDIRLLLGMFHQIIQVGKKTDQEMLEPMKAETWFLWNLSGTKQVGEGEKAA